MLQRRLSPQICSFQLLHSVDFIFHNLVALSLVGIIFCFTSCCLLILLTTHVCYVATSKSLDFFFATNQKKKRFINIKPIKTSTKLKISEQKQPKFLKKMRTLVYLLREKKPTKKLHTKAKGIMSKGSPYRTSSSLKPYIVLIFWH